MRPSGTCASCGSDHSYISPGASVLWMTFAQLSLMTPLSLPPQLCPGPTVFSPPGPAWSPEVPSSAANPGPELRVRLERSHSHIPTLPSQADPGRPGVLWGRVSSLGAWGGPGQRGSPVLLCSPRSLFFQGLLTCEVKGLRRGVSKAFLGIF